ncbi:MAG TPA: PadR family transcriptional regulator [Thermoleophilaceae bacterium]|jgi:DNA-binding PadR family transcriptional regulator
MSTPALTPTGRLILGMVRMGKRTGYEIKQLVDVSARFFWTTSYGQIYPELKRLEEAGLVTGAPEPTGGRSRTVYSMTAAGDAALDDWLGSRAELVWELRDEGLLKLFFSEGRDLGEVREHLSAVRERSEAVAEQLRGLRSDVNPDPDPGPRMVLEFGVAFNEWLAEYWGRIDEQLEAKSRPRAAAGR